MPDNTDQSQPVSQPALRGETTNDRKVIGLSLVRQILAITRWNTRGTPIAKLGIPDSESRKLRKVTTP